MAEQHCCSLISTASDEQGAMNSVHPHMSVNYSMHRPSPRGLLGRLPTEIREMIYPLVLAKNTTLDHREGNHHVMLHVIHQMSYL